MTRQSEGPRDTTIAFAYDHAKPVHAVEITSRCPGTGCRGESDEASIGQGRGDGSAMPWQRCMGEETD